jgi:16S rRNA (uracil1498-N3)-methyltransferase
MGAEIGSQIEVFDSSQKSYIVEITSVSPTLIETKIISEKLNDVEPKVKITLAVGLPKGKKMDQIVRQATELGVYSIIPIMSERSIPKIEEKEGKKISHWQAIAKEAAEQSGRTRVPEIHNLKRIENLTKEGFDLAIMPWENEKKNTIKDIFSNVRPEQNILLLTGPEGGFSGSEVQTKINGGFVPVSLGKRILRAETAPISALSIIFNYLDN